MNKIPIITGLALLLGASSAAGEEQSTDEPGRLSAYEPPTLRDFDDQVVNLGDIEAGEERALGDFMEATGHETHVTVVRHGPQDPLEVDCQRGSDRCLVIIHSDGTAELHRTRTMKCADAGTVSAPEVESAPGVFLRPVVRNGKCFEDLRVMATAAEQ